MDIPVDLQPRELLIHPAALAQHLQTILMSDPSQEGLSSINSHILHQAHTEAIPYSVYQVWLFIAYQHSPHLLSGALRDRESAAVRIAGIKVLRHIFRKPLWKTYGWDSLGGAQGMKDIIDGLPLAEVRLFIKAISQDSQGPNKRFLATCIDELVALIESSNTWNTRSLSSYVAPLYARCTSEKVIKILRSGIPSSPKFYRDVGRLHPNLLRQAAIGVVEVPPHRRLYILETCANILLRSNKEYAPVHATEIQSGISPGLAFGVDLLLQINTSEPDLRANWTLIRQWTEQVVSLAIRRGLPFDSILYIIRSSLEISRAVNYSYWSSQHLPTHVIRCWSMVRFGVSGDKWPFYPAMKNAQASSPSRPRAVNQAALERCLIEQVLQIKDERLSVQPKQADFTRQLTQLLSNVHIDGRFEFLRLLCRHAPTLGFDLSAWPPSEEERKLIPVWEHSVLSMLPMSSSKALFQRSLQIHHCDTILPSDLVEKNSWALSWEQQCLLWARWEYSTAKSTDDFLVTQKALAEMKQRATREREGSGRLTWARAAIKLASETKSPVFYYDLVQWSQRFLRDQQVFPSILALIYMTAGHVLPCGADMRAVKLASKPDLRAAVQKAHLTLKTLLESLLLLLREPWARNMKGITGMVGSMFSAIVRQRMNAVKFYLSNELATEAELTETLLDPLLPIIIDYEREGNTEGQAAFAWSGPAGLIGCITCPDNPSQVDLSFMDRLAKARDELWKDLRAHDKPDISILGPGWPRGLPIQYLATDEAWFYHALKRPEEAPFLFSKINEIIFSSQDIVVAVVPHVSEPIGKFADDLGFAIRATISCGPDKLEWITLIWKHYSSVLQAHPLYLELFQEWLVDLLRRGHVADEAINAVQPPVAPAPAPLISRVPMGSEVTKWDPQHDAEDTVQVDVPFADVQRPKEIPCILLNCRMPSTSRASDGFVRTREIKPRPRPNPIALWLNDSSSSSTARKEISVNNRETVILSALLFLDTLNPQPRLLQKRFPDTESPRYGSTYLAEEFIARVISSDVIAPMTGALDALKRNSRDVPAQILRDLICSFLDTLKASPKDSKYPKLLDYTFELINLLLHGSQPHLVAGVVLRVWKEFPNDSSSHRRVSLVKIGRILTPDQASDLMQRFVANACDTPQNRQAPDDSAEKLPMKITTVKMLVQGLAEADFLQLSTRLHLLEIMCGTSSHIDVRVAIVNSIFQLTRQNQSADILKVLSTIALSAAGPSERDTVTDDDWRAAEAGGRLPLILGSQRPILDLIVSNAAQQIPKELRSAYVREVVLPLVTESIRQHTRWMAVLLARLGLSLSGLGLAASDIGPFSSDLVDQVLLKWARYLPDTYLQYHRSWGLIYLHRDSFNRITEALALSTDPIKEDANVRDHLQALIKSQRSRCPFRYAYRVPYYLDSEEPNGITDELLLDEFISRVEVFSRSPMAYNSLLGRHSVHPGYTLGVLQGLRKARRELHGFSPSLYTHATKLMTSIADAAEIVRKEGWSPNLTAHPVTVPTAFEYEVELLPSPLWNPPPSNSALSDFVSGITRLISKYAADPVLLLTIDSFAPVMKEVRQEDREACALLLGEKCDDGNGLNRLVETWVRVKLAVMLLETAKKPGVPLNESVLNMIKRWKGSDIEMVRQTAWAWDWKN
ncbi:unnamed protein product [Penicillium glandicola]